MKAVVVAADRGVKSGMQSGRLWGPMLPLVDRPFVQHVVELVIDLGADEVILAASDAAPQLAELFGDGTRWGVPIRVAGGFGAAMAMAGPAEPGGAASPVLVAHADRLPSLDAAAVQAAIALATTVLFARAERAEWSGWAVTAARMADTVEPVDSDAAIEAFLLDSVRNPRVVEVERVLDARSHAGALEAQAAVLSGAAPELLLTGTDRGDGIRVGRGAIVHSSARLIGPVFVGEHTRIHANAVVGPNVVIGADCVIDASSVVENSLIAPGTYSGEGLDIRWSIVDRGRIASVEHDTVTDVPDGFIVGSLVGTPSWRVGADSAPVAAPSRSGRTTAHLPLAGLASRIFHLRAL